MLCYVMATSACLAVNIDENMTTDAETLLFLRLVLILISGFTHAAFALGYESGLNKCPTDGYLIPPGALVTFVQKGLRYIELEANLGGVSSSGLENAAQWFLHYNDLDQSFF